MDFMNKTWNSSASDSPVHHDTVLMTLHGIIGFLGIIGNGLVCVVFFFERPVFGSVTNAIILNQSVIDLLTSVLFFILKFAPTGRGGVYLNSLDYFHIFVCHIWISEFLFWSLSGASTFNLMLLSAERYFAICRSIKHKIVFTEKRAKIYCIYVWIAGFLLNIYLPLVHISDDRECVFSWPNTTAQKCTGLILFLAGYAVPLVVIIASYVKIWLALRRRVNSDQVQVASFSRAKKNVTVTLLLVAIFFIICWSPDSFVYFYFNMGGYHDFQSRFHHFVMILVLCNMIVNPFVYCMKYDKFRRSLKKMICGAHSVNDVEDDTTNTS